MSTEHTSGPWAANGISIAAVESGKSIATVYPDTSVSSAKSLSTMRANARLIAQAPAMVEAIRLIVAAADEGDADKAMNAHDAARAILARIDGEPS